MDLCITRGLLFAYLNILLIGCGTSSELVPVYIWESTESSDLVPALGHINKATFQELLLQKIDKNNPYIVVFAEQNLSPEDFIEEYKKTFQYFPQVQLNSKVSYLPLVETPIEAVKQLPSKKFLEVSINDMLKKVSLPDSHILIVKFNDAKDDEDRINMLRRHDSQIFNIYNDLLKKHKRVLAMFTGYQSSWIVPEEIKSHRDRRSTDNETEEEIAKNNQTHVAFTTENILVFLRNNVYYKNITDEKSEKSYKVTGASQTKADGGEDGVNVTLTLTTDQTKNIIFDMHAVSGYWFVRSVELEGVTQYPVNKMFAPYEFSYHCDQQNLTHDKSLLYLPGLQIQYTDNNTNANTSRFGDAYDCVGFTTAPIWSGLFVTLILAVIMTIGLSMMMDIKTMDKFDDPKGKTIIINASE